jgi:hypothetical protein
MDGVFDVLTMGDGIDVHEGPRVSRTMAKPVFYAAS